MTYKTKAKKRNWRIRVYTRKGIPINVHNFEIKAKTDKEAEKMARKKVIKDNPDKPKRYFFVVAD
jgi:hypothetical protein